MHEEIFSLCYHSKGGFIWGEVYEMPVFLRRFYLKKLVEQINKENEEYEKSSKSSGKMPSMPSMPSIPRK